MANVKKQMHLGAFLYATGHHVAAWRHSDAEPRSGLHFEHYLELAKHCESACFDFIFLEDGTGIREPDLNVASKTSRAAHFEPLTLLSAIAVNTSQIGVIGTVSTSYNEPYNLARTVASLDHLSGGRAGWNLVTSATDLEAQNFGLNTQQLHQDRYARAEEFVDVVTGLWQSYEHDTLVLDKASGRYYNPEKLHQLNHKGQHFSVRGPLNSLRSRQDKPLIVQAGASADGLKLAARTADMVFSAAQTLEEGQHYYRSLKQLAESFGRSRDDILVMPGIFPLVGKTRQQAQDKFDELQNLIPEKVGLALLSQHLGVKDLDKLPLDEPVPTTLLPTNGNKSRQQLLLDFALREQLTLRELSLKIAGARGHWQVIGSAEDIADQMEQRFTEGAADGFNIMPPLLPGGLYDFIEQVLPVLRHRGLVKDNYQGSTLRQHLGLNN
ncbi:LLM class flavin-dependent oxidoreductase [Klebsiella sp. BIGb0407]|uniref:LLM class flavin-dependent oxidoreductase n=1 Tax=Klebsiella sp. BIGb0407 TaxID=2940603 RepID=UPI002167D078|nr:LLM class flavin-dependent oxidoreductase [Klebsiella sp. BIGb0407]MCS3429871.1 FMN-dependent oxidoreductase (nitrilotriacetate monooxygenase family) [Klebsiella sp. BIGb0407]